MTDEKRCNNPKEIDIMLMFSIGGLLIKSIEDFQEDIQKNLSFAHELLVRPTYMRIMELKDKLNQVLLTVNPDFFNP